MVPRRRCRGGGAEAVVPRRCLRSTCCALEARRRDLRAPHVELSLHGGGGAVESLQHRLPIAREAVHRCAKCTVESFRLLATPSCLQHVHSMPTARLARLQRGHMYARSTATARGLPARPRCASRRLCCSCCAGRSAARRRATGRAQSVITEAQGRTGHRGVGTLVALPLLRCNERGWVCFRESGPRMRFRRARQIQTRASRRSTRASHRLDSPVAARPAAVTRGLPASHPCWHHRPARLYHPRCQQTSLRPGQSLRCSATTGGRRHAYARSRLRREGRWWWTGREMARARARDRHPMMNDHCFGKHVATSAWD